LSMSRAEAVRLAAIHGAKGLLAQWRPAPAPLPTVPEPVHVPITAHGQQAPGDSVKGRALAHMQQTQHSFTLKELAVALDFSDKTQASLLRTLATAGKVRKEDDGRYRAVMP
jgi:hypothetical protein